MSVVYALYGVKVDYLKVFKWYERYTICSPMDILHTDTKRQIDIVYHRVDVSTLSD